MAKQTKKKNPGKRHPTPKDWLPESVALGEFLGLTANLLRGQERDGKIRFMPHKAWRRLASDNIPHAIVVGRRGSGKTHLAEVLLECGTWGGFVREVDPACGLDSVPGAAIVPFFTREEKADPRLSFPGGMGVSMEMSAALAAIEAIGKLVDARSSIEDADRLHPVPFMDARETFRSRGESPDRVWEGLWMRLFARFFGIPDDAGNVREELERRISGRREPVVIVMDDADKLFDWWDGKSIAPLRVLLQDVFPDIARWGGDRVGLVVLVDEDMAKRAVMQNSGQFLAKWGEFALGWDKEEILGFVGWMEAGRWVGCLRDIQDCRGRVSPRDFVEVARMAAMERRKHGLSDRTNLARAFGSWAWAYPCGRIPRRVSDAACRVAEASGRKLPVPFGLDCGNDIGILLDAGALARTDEGFCFSPFWCRRLGIRPDAEAKRMMRKMMAKVCA